MFHSPAFQIQALSLQAETASTPSVLSDDPWQEWNPSDYGNAEEYCRSLQGGSIPLPSTTLP